MSNAEAIRHLARAISILAVRTANEIGTDSAGQVVELCEKAVQASTEQES